MTQSDHLRLIAVADLGFSGGVPTLKVGVIANLSIFVENCMKMKEFGPRGTSLAPA